MILDVNITYSRLPGACDTGCETRRHRVRTIFHEKATTKTHGPDIHPFKSELSWAMSGAFCFIKFYQNKFYQPHREHVKASKH